jgi:hypothetical protein
MMGYRCQILEFRTLPNVRSRVRPGGHGTTAMGGQADACQRLRSLSSRRNGTAKFHAHLKPAPTPFKTAPPAHYFPKQHFLYFFPLPQGQASLRPISGDRGPIAAGVCRRPVAGWAGSGRARTAERQVPSRYRRAAGWRPGLAYSAPGRWRRLRDTAAGVSVHARSLDGVTEEAGAAIWCKNLKMCNEGKTGTCLMRKPLQLSCYRKVVGRCDCTRR